jgi:XRE family transcriptional regulator, regulator of sulfur utilization
MISRRDVFVAVVSMSATMVFVALAQSVPKEVLHSAVFRWSEMKVEPASFGERRAVFDAPTAHLDRFECHVTTLHPGQSPHAAHRHPHEEMMIIREGTLEAIQDGRTNRVDAGGIIFCASNEMHGLRNVGASRATYYVLAWYPPGVEKSKTD